MSDSTQTSNIDLNFRLVCKYCKRDPPNIVEDYKAGDLVCGDCGLVFPMRIIDQRSEWRSFNDETSGGDPSRVGQAENPILEGVEDTLSTQIHFRDGRTGMSDTLRKTQHKVSGSVKGSRDLTESFRLIQHFTERISLPRIVSDRAKQLYKRIFDEDHAKGKPNDGIIAACIFLACRQERVGRTFKEIAQLTRVDRKTVAACVKAIIPLVGPSQQSTDDYVARFCSHLNLSESIKNAAVAVVKKATDENILAGRSPLTVVGACIFLITQLSQTPKTEREISPVAGVSEATIRSAYRDLYPHRMELVPRESAFFKALPQLIAPTMRSESASNLS